MSPACTTVGDQFTGILQEGGGKGVLVGIVVLVGVGDSSGGGSVAVAVRGIGDGSRISVDAGATGGVNSTNDNESPPITRPAERMASIKAFPNWRKDCIISFPWI